MKAIDRIDGSTEIMFQPQTALAQGTSVSCYGDYGRMGELSILVCYGNLSEEGFDYCFTIDDGSNPSNPDQCDPDP